MDPGYVVEWTSGPTLMDPGYVVEWTSGPTLMDPGHTVEWTSGSALTYPAYMMEMMAWRSTIVFLLNKYVRNSRFHHMASVPCTRTCNPLMRGLSHPGKKKEKKPRISPVIQATRRPGQRKKCDVGLCLDWYSLAPSCNMMHSASCWWMT